MNIPDKVKARHYLSHINYYRLVAYWLPFEADHETHTFKEGTDFDRVIELYVFDRELRLALLDAIERIEVSLRTQIAYHLSNKYGPHAHLNHEVFKDYSKYTRNLSTMCGVVFGSREKFVTHLLRKYDEPLPPLWATVDLLSLGHLSKLFSNIRLPSDRQLISSIYRVDETLLMSFLHHLTTVRNLCAHHSRVWNREFTFKMKIPHKKPRHLSESLNKRAENKLYNTLCWLNYMLSIISPESEWRQSILNLMGEHEISKSAVGFPDGYESYEIWKPTENN